MYFACKMQHTSISTAIVNILTIRFGYMYTMYNVMQIEHDYTILNCHFLQHKIAGIRKLFSCFKHFVIDEKQCDKP